ncbi:hypothetical protein AVEN_22440-1, partial [Araneus ventricosus]
MAIRRVKFDFAETVQRAYKQCLDVATITFNGLIHHPWSNYDQWLKGNFIKRMLTEMINRMYTLTGEL